MTKLNPRQWFRGDAAGLKFVTYAQKLYAHRSAEHDVPRIDFQC